MVSNFRNVIWNTKRGWKMDIWLYLETGSSLCKNLPHAHLSRGRMHLPFHPFALVLPPLNPSWCPEAGSVPCACCTASFRELRPKGFWLWGQVEKRPWGPGQRGVWGGSWGPQRGGAPLCLQGPHLDLHPAVERKERTVTRLWLRRLVLCTHRAGSLEPWPSTPAGAACRGAQAYSSCWSSLTRLRSMANMCTFALSTWGEELTFNNVVVVFR